MINWLKLPILAHPKRKEVNSMVKKDLVAVVQRATGSTMKSAEAAVNALFEGVMDALANGDRVLITGFGAFEVRKRRERTGVNPQNTSQKIRLPESRIPAFRAGKRFKDRVQK